MIDRQLNTEREEQWGELYEKYGTPLEADHRGEFLAVSPDGRTLLAETFRDAVQQSTRAFGPGNFVYKVGERFVGTALCANGSSAPGIPISIST